MATPVSSPFDAKVAVHNYENHQDTHTYARYRMYYWYVRKPCGSPELFMFFYIVLYMGNRLSAFFFAAVGNSILTRIYRLKNTTDMYLMPTPLILYIIIAVYQNSHVHNVRQ